ncbi:MAG TPA: GLUG motif-containing protein [Rhizomicrobium sp.]
MSAFGGLTRAVSTCALLGGAAISTSQSNAAVTISKGTTQNISCVSGVCTPTSQNAVLNVTDLKNLLASGNVQVNTGSGSLAQQVEDIVVSKGFSWTSASSLTLDAYRSVTFNAAVAVNGAGAVTLTTNDGGANGNLTFVSNGSLSFLGTANSLSIDGTAFTLENSVATLASAVVGNPSGFYALARNYDAGVDGTYSTSPIATTLSGTVQGLGNTISNLSISGSAAGSSVGLFAEIGAGGSAGGLRLSHIAFTVSAPSPQSIQLGGLVGENLGSVTDDRVLGRIDASGGATFNYQVGGVAGLNEGTINASSSNVVINTKNVIAPVQCFGGLVGSQLRGEIGTSFAEGKIKSRDPAAAGGLVGLNEDGTIANSYATGPLGGYAEYVGGLIGYNSDASSISSSYSVGHVSRGSYTGGFIGLNSSSSMDDSYWDTNTSGTDVGVGSGDATGVTGLTTAQLQAGLPTGFDPTIWAENPKLNGGFPYLFANPPVKK